MSETPAARSRMTAERLAEIYDIVIDLLQERGYERLTLDEAAARARTSKMTLYRQWNGKQGLVMAALRHHRSLTPPEAVEHASIDDALESMAAEAEHEHPFDVRLVFALLHAAALDPDVGAELRAAFVAPNAEVLAEVFRQAAARGEIERDDALFQRLAYLIIEHFVLLGVLDGDSDSVESRRAFFRSVIRPALTFLPPR